MGFGLLFIGYFISSLMSLNPLGWAFQIIGFYIVFRALCKLAEYKHSFALCFMPLLLMTICQILFGARELTASVPSGIFAFLQNSLAETLISTASVTLLMIFHFLMLSSLRALALDVEDLYIAKLARVNIYIVGVYFVLNILCTFLPMGGALSALRPITLLYSILYPVFVLYLIFRCYARICAPEDHDMEKKPSRFAFINKRRERSEKANEKMDELVDRLSEQEKNKK